MTDPVPEDTVELVRRWESGDQAAAGDLYHRYAQRLLALAQSRLPSDLRPRTDNEDVVQSVYRSFFRRTTRGDLSIERSGDLWRLLARMTINKSIKSVERNRSQKRDTRREVADQQSLRAATADPGPEETAAALEQLKTTGRAGGMRKAPKRGR
jgi:hypothetical protein